MPAKKSQFSNIHLQPRDLSILRGLFECRIMTGAHIAALYFEGRKEAAKKRLQALKAEGLIGERKRRSFEPSVLFLAPKAFALLRKEGILAEYPKLQASSLAKRSTVSELTVRHELDVMDVKAAFHSAISKTSAFAVAEFSTWPSLNQFEVCRDGYGSSILVKPDGFIRIHEKEPDGGLSEHTFFLEVDRSSETLDTLVSRMACYAWYYRSGGFAVRNGGTPLHFKEYPFRVLMVFRSAERRNNMAERLVESTPPVLTQAWLTTQMEIVADPLAAVWIQPGDYRSVTMGTLFEPGRKQRTAEYRRQSERETLVESTIKKLPLLESLLPPLPPPVPLQQQGGAPQAN